MTCMEGQFRSSFGLDLVATELGTTRRHNLRAPTSLGNRKPVLASCGAFSNKTIILLVFTELIAAA